MCAPDLAALARRHGIILLLQFGSSVTGREHPQSDVDLAPLQEFAAKSVEAYLASGLTAKAISNLRLFTDLSTAI